MATNNNFDGQTKEAYYAEADSYNFTKEELDVLKKAMVKFYRLSAHTELKEGALAIWNHLKEVEKHA